MKYRVLSGISLMVAMALLGTLLMTGYLLEGDPATDITIKEKWIFEGGFYLFLSLFILFAILGRKKRRRNAFKQDPYRYTVN